MLVVADTSPLNYLIQLGYPEVLRSLYGRVIVPAAVLRELQHRNAPSLVRGWASSPPEWIEQRQVRQLDSSLKKQLGAGEREAISLALTLPAGLLLMDERSGRAEAEARNLAVTGTLSVILQASQRNLIAPFGEIDRLRQLGFRFSLQLEERTKFFLRR